MIREYINKKQGIFKKMLKRFISSNIVNIYDMIYLHINSKNKVSKMLFTHIGFKICDEIKYFSLKKELINKYFK